MKYSKSVWKYTTIHFFFFKNYDYYFFKQMNSFIQQGYLKLINSDSKEKM